MSEYTSKDYTRMAADAEAKGDTENARILTEAANRLRTEAANNAAGNTMDVPTLDTSTEPRQGDAGIPNVLMEGVTAVNRIGAGILDVATSPVQALLAATGVDIPSFSSGVPEKGHYAGDGLATESINNAVELASFAVPSGFGMRVASKALVQATKLGDGVVKKILQSIGQTTVKQDIATGAISGASGVYGGEVAAQSFGEEWRGTGEFLTEVMSPSAWLGATNTIRQSVASAAPSVAQLRGASKTLYTLLDEAGLEADPSSIKAMGSEIAAFADDNGLTLAAKGHGAVSARLTKLQKEIDAGRMTYGMLDQISTSSRADAAASSDAVARLHELTADMVDTMIFKMNPKANMETGVPSLGGRQIKDVLDDAKDYWRRSKVVGAIEEVQNKALKDSTARRSDFNQAYRNGLNELTQGKLSQFMTKREIASIEDVVKGGSVERIAEGTAKLLGINSADYVKAMGVSLVIGAGVTGGGQGAMLASGGLLSLAAVGKVIGKSSQAMFKDNAAMMKGQIAAGPKAKLIIANYNRFTQPRDRNSQDLAKLLLLNKAELSDLPSSLGRIPWMADAAWMAGATQSAMETMESGEQ